MVQVILIFETSNIIPKKKSISSIVVELNPIIIKETCKVLFSMLVRSHVEMPKLLGVFKVQ